MPIVVLWVLATGVSCCAAEPQPKETTNSVGMKFALIPAGKFLMGSGDPPQELLKVYPQYKHMAEYYSDELPQHRVRITKAYYIGKYEVTNSQFRRFIDSTGYKTQAERDEPADPKGSGGWAFNQREQKFEGRRREFNWRNPGFPVRDSQPVVDVTWHDVVAFCQWLSKKEGRTYRLPTEAEWEYAARAGTRTRYWSGDNPESLVKVANIADAAFFKAFPRYYPRDKTLSGNDGYALPASIGSFPANAFGLHDIHGNVWEWTADWYDEDYYKKSSHDDPQGPTTGRQKVRRGGAWHTAPLYARVSYRNYNTPESRYPNLGFRLVRNAE
jgi:formylglycine-generating enzyme required for sulfatase activity